MEFIQNFNYNYLILTGLLVIAGLFLEHWQPPIKKQYMALILFALGGTLGWYMDGAIWEYGLLISGLVYYKRELVEEIREIISCFKDTKDIIDEK